ncbi:MAG: flagellar hook capping FlgD N-terminal domain-containing protein, partial [Rhodospirillaceae bacterium]
MSSSLLSSASTSNSTAANLLINQKATGSGTSGSSSSGTDSMSALNYNFKEFLTLFTTQLKNQDPSNPMDTTQMTNQLAMFSQVEQQAGTNSRL